MCTQKLCIVNGSDTVDRLYQIELLGDASFAATNPDTPISYKSMMVFWGGTLRLIGHPGRSGSFPMHRLAATAAAGATEITLRPDVGAGLNGLPVPWSVGDEIVVATTAFHRIGLVNPYPTTREDLSAKYASGNYGEQNERRRVIAIAASTTVSGGTTISLDRPLRMAHFGEPPMVFQPGKPVLDESAHVVNLNRNLRIFGSVGPIDTVQPTQEPDDGATTTPPNAAGAFQDLVTVRGALL